MKNKEILDDSNKIQNKNWFMGRPKPFQPGDGHYRLWGPACCHRQPKNLIKHCADKPKNVWNADAVGRNIFSFLNEGIEL